MKDMGRFQEKIGDSSAKVGALGRVGRIVLMSGFVLTLLVSLFLGHSATARKKSPSPIVSSESPEDASRRAGFPAFQSMPEVAQRPLYPYSVIPGGVETARELKNAVERDPVVAGHYAGFNLTKARVIRLDTDRMEYVSYRLGDRIYWTNHALKLFKGETLISDGTHEARTRCGNRLSDIAMGPVSPKQPSPEAMEAWLNPELVAMNGFPLDVSPLPLLSSPVPPGSPIAAPGGSSAGVAIPPVVFPIAGGGGSLNPNVPTGPPGGTTPGSPSGPPVGPPGGGPPISTPEPPAAALLAAGLSILASLRKRRKA